METRAGYDAGGPGGGDQPALLTAGELDALQARMEAMASGAIDHERQINLGRRIGAGVYAGLTDATRDGGEGVTVEYLRLLVACDMGEGYRRHGISTEEQLLAHPWEVRAQAHRVALWRQVDVEAGENGGE